MALVPTAVWTVGVGVWGGVFGLLALDIAAFAARSPGMQRIGEEFGGIRIGSAKGFIGFVFAIVVVPVALFAAFRLQASREEEASGRLESVLARAVGRRRWMLSQAAVAIGTAAVTWAAVASRGADLGIASMLLAGVNCLPVAFLFLGIEVLALAALPRAAPAIALGAIAVTYLLQLIGGLATVPRFVLDLSPFHHVSPVPATAVNGGAALAMLAIGLACASAGAELFARRDLAGA